MDLCMKEKINDIKSKKLYLIARVSHLNERARVYKLHELLKLKDIYHEILMVKDMNSIEPTNIDKYAINYILNRNFCLRSKFIEYIFWFISVMYFSRSRKNSYFYCIGLESALPVAFLSKGKFIFFDNPDNFGLSYRMPEIFKKIFFYFENFTSTKSKIHLIPGESRRTCIGNNLYIVKNTPSSRIYEAAEKIATIKGYKKGGVFTIYLNGWLVKDRGLDQLLETANQLDKKNLKFKIIMAGTLGCKSAETLSSRKYTQYLGTLPNDEALALYFKSDIAFTFYDPTVPINMLAEPNKWGDCMATNTPFIANSEIKTLSIYLNNDSCFTVPYYDVNTLVKFFVEIIANPQLLVNKSKNLKRIEYKFWDIAMSDLLDNFLS